MRSFSLFCIGVAFAEDLCSDGTCSADEETMLQLHGMRHQFNASLDQEPDADGVLNRDTQCWHTNQCNRQGGECPSGYCGAGGVCCRRNWNARNAQEALECGQNGYGILNHHTCQPRILNEGQQCWHTGQCDQQGGRCQNYCGARGVCCRANWNARNDKEREECGQNGHGNNGMHQCHLPPDWVEDQCNARYEAEDATLNGGQVDSNHEGFTGSGFFNYLARNDDYIEWTLPGCSGGLARLDVRYALNGGNRPLQVLLNGDEVEGALAFANTRSWERYGRASLTVRLRAGTNTVRLVATGSSGANVDSLIVLSGEPSYTIAPYGDAACPAGKDITTADECRTAHTQLGLEIAPEWNGRHNGIPAACSTREYNWGGQHHFHFDTKAIGQGRARADLAPVCKV